MGKTIKFCIIFVISFLMTESCCTGAETAKSLVAEAEKAVLAGLRSSDGRIRANAIEVVSAVSAGEKSVFLPKIVELLNDEVMPGGVRFAAAVALGDLQYEKCENQLQQLLNNPDLNLKIAVAYALCRLGEKQHLSIIEKAAHADDQTVKANAAILLGKLKSTESLAILYHLKDSEDSSDAVAFNATEAIARIGDEKIYPKIWTMLISVYADDRYMGIRAMGALGGAKGANALLTMLDDEVIEIRLAAAEQLGALGDVSGQFVVLEYLNSSQQVEKIVVERRNVLAALAIGQIGTEKLVEYLPKLLKNDSPAVQLAAAKSVFMLAGHN
jgi:HEAT repeat protein